MAYATLEKNTALAEKSATERQDKSYRAKQAELFLETMKGFPEGANVENTELFMALVDKVIVGEGLTFVLRDGTVQKVNGVR